jgi:uncharacterized protein (TIGR01777 family)
MKLVICGATGFVGRNLVAALIKEQHDITVVGRTTDKIQKLFNQTVRAVTWDQLSTLIPDDFDAVINLAGETIAQTRWTKQAMQTILTSRVQATQRVVNWCLTSRTKKPHIYNASAIGIYGLQSTQATLPIPLTEAYRIPVGAPSDFLSEVGQAWEAAANQATANQHPLTLMRFAVVLKKNEGVLKKLALPFSLGLGSRIGSGDQAFTWIHIDDLVNAILFLLHHPDITGPINVCAPECVSQKTFAQSLATTLHRPLLFSMPAAVVKLLFGQMGEELLLGGQNIYPERLLQSKFNFLYPNLLSALKHEWP